MKAHTQVITGSSPAPGHCAGCWDPRRNSHVPWPEACAVAHLGYDHPPMSSCAFTVEWLPDEDEWLATYSMSDDKVWSDKDPMEALRMLMILLRKHGIGE